MTNNWRKVLRVGLFLVAIGAIAGIGLFSVQRLFRGSSGGSDTPGKTAMTQPEGSKSLTQTLLGMYLSLRQDDIVRPFNPSDTSKVPFSIEPGETASTIGPRLVTAGIIQDASLFSQVVRYRGVDSSLEVGEYQLSPSMSLDQVITELQHGTVKGIRVTIPEGWRMEQVAQKLSEAGLGKAEDFLPLMRKSDYNYTWLQGRATDAPQGLEGFLFPDTYEFPADATPIAVVDAMLRNFDQKVTPDLRKALTSHGLTFYEAITLAAIVEREAVVAEERPTIAGVFLNRLDKGMWLQADPTVSYAKGYDAATKRWWTPMMEEDAKGVESDYNTFLHGGLTPGPICSPGLSSLEAVGHPATTQYLYFVSKGDGSHAFAQTYDEHLANMRKYQP